MLEGRNAACKQGLDEALDNTVVSFGKYLFQCVPLSPSFAGRYRGVIADL